VARRGLTGVLLVGGASTRFGSPKALAQLDGETLVQRAWQTIGAACEERLAVGKNADGLELPFELVDDGTDVRAPIAGVVAGLRTARHDVCVFLPVDCPLISVDSLLRLAASTPARPQTGPLPGAYPRTLLPELERKLERGDYSLRNLPATVLELDARELANVNTPADLDALRRTT
jgi:molybdopterin-guanine dinucleotide biosynthesis protein A